ncbi:MAG: glycosyltransferase [Alphaproteobacteria bacterium]|nr:glycosyltransferase [Alphaproteobacteria bacterium]
MAETDFAKPVSPVRGTADAPSAVSLSIVVPVYNEAGNVLPLVAEIIAAMEGGVPYEILLVDDGSSDSGVQEMTEARERWPNIRVVTHTGRAGKSAALFTAGLVARGAWLQTLDGDGQNDPKDVMRAWNAVNGPNAPRNVGILAGQRTSRNDGSFKWLQSRIANGIRRFALNDGTRDTGCGFKLIRAEAFRTMPFFDGMHRFLPALARRAGYEVMEFPVVDRPRTAGASKYGFLGRLGAGIVDLLGVIWLVRRSSFPPGRKGDL